MEECDGYYPLRFFLEHEWDTKKGAFLYHDTDDLISVVLVNTSLYGWYISEFRDALLVHTKDTSPEFLWSKTEDHNPLTLFRMFPFGVEDSELNYYNFLNTLLSKGKPSHQLSCSFVRHVFMPRAQKSLGMRTKLFLLGLNFTSLVICEKEYDESFPKEVKEAAQILGDNMMKVVSELTDLWLESFHVKIGKYSNTREWLSYMVSRYMGKSLSSLRKKTDLNILYYLDNYKWEEFLDTYGFDIILEGNADARSAICTHFGKLYMMHGLESILPLIEKTNVSLSYLKESIQNEIVKRIVIYSPNDRFLSELKLCKRFYHYTVDNAISIAFQDRIATLIQNNEFIEVYKITLVNIFYELLGIVGDNSSISKAIAGVGAKGVFWDNLGGMIHPRIAYRRCYTRTSYLDMCVVARGIHFLPATIMQDHMISLFWSFLTEKSLHFYYNACMDYNPPVGFRFFLPHNGERFIGLVNGLRTRKKYDHKVCSVCKKFKHECFLEMEHSLYLFPEYEFVKNGMEPQVLLYDDEPI
jgi:hypothetical protein